MLKVISKIVLLFGFLCLYGFLNPEREFGFEKNTVPFNTVDTKWVDSVYASLSLDERIGQLFMVAVYTTPQQSNRQQIADLIQKHHIGGLIFMRGTPVRQAQYTNYFQSLSKTPLMMAIDGEWGLAMRLDSTIAFPKQMMLGAISDNRLLYEMGKEIGRQCNRIGLQINFAPVVDVNNNIQNPVINFRSFGEVKENVARKGRYYMAGMQDMNILTTAKHFPGHGDTDSDSHYSLPIINHTKQRLDSVELYPFKYLIHNELTGMMIAHLYIPAYDKTPNRASTLSPAIVTDILKDELGFEGLIFTDALNMKGVSKFFKPGELEVKALIAGNDVLLFPENVPVAVAAIKEAIQNGSIDERIIEERCKKILRAKKWMGLDTLQPVEIDNLISDLNTPHAEMLSKQLIRAAITVVKDNAQNLPFPRLDTARIAYVSFLHEAADTFFVAAKNYAPISQFALGTNPSEQKVAEVLDSLSYFTHVILNVAGNSMFASRKYGIRNDVVAAVAQISHNHSNCIFVLHANPYALEYFTASFSKIPTVVVAYDYTSLVQFETPQVLFGAYPAHASLPVSAGGFSAGTGVSYESIYRLRYTVPFEGGMNGAVLQKIDSVVAHAIQEKAFPGCQVLVARKGNVVFHKSYGHFTYEKKRAVTPDDLYDIASITKALGTTISLMKLYDRELFDLQSTIGDFFYFEGIDTTGKDTIRMIDILTHQSRLFSWIPFYQHMIKDFLNLQVKDLRARRPSATHPHKVSNVLYLRHDYRFIDSSISNTRSELFSVEVAENVYITEAYRDTIFAKIFASQLNKDSGVVYSDLGFYLLPEVIAQLSGKPIDEFLYSEFYNTIGAYTTCFNPLTRFAKNQIAPTEHDKIFRKQVLQGHVHDPGVAMLGGIGGHAGLFSNANDIAKLSQMLLQGGHYGGFRYISQETVDLFTSCVYCEQDNRKGIGFDKAWADPSKLDPTCKCTSALSYGHTGFTGVIFWVDPQHDLVYVFLSNRVHPDAENTKIGTLRVRPTIQKIVYDSFLQ